MPPPPTELQLLAAKWERWCAKLVLAPRDSEDFSEDELDVATLQPMAMPSLA